MKARLPGQGAGGLYEVGGEIPESGGFPPEGSRQDLEWTIDGGEASPMKKSYEKPAIIHTETIEARALRCAKIDDNACPGGPVTS